MTQFGGIRTKYPTLSFMIKKTAARSWAYMSHPTPPPEQLSIFIELCGHRHLLYMPLITKELDQGVRLN